MSRGAKCAVCGEPRSVCTGAPGTSGMNVIDLPPRAEGASKVPTEEYNVTINGMRTVLNLSPEDAKRYELTDADKVNAGKSADTKARAPQNKGR